MIESPCIKVCTLDAAGRLCLGCFRTVEEIGAWTGLEDAARRTVLEQVEARRRAYEMAARSAGH